MTGDPRRFYDNPIGSVRRGEPGRLEDAIEELRDDDTYERAMDALEAGRLDEVRTILRAEGLWPEEPAS